MKDKLILGTLLAILVILALLFVSDNEEVEVTVPESPPVKKINVYVSGQVKTPAVVKLDDTGDLRAVDAVNAVGGFTEFADTAIVNLAEPIADGQHIHIPTKEIFLIDSSVAMSKNLGGSQISARININTADAAELQSIKGVGPTISQRIVDYREQNGPFKAIEEIKKVRGIGNKVFDKMKDTITVQ